MPRIKQLSEKADLPPEQHAEYDRIVEVLHGVRGPFTFLLHSPGLAQKVMEAGAQVRLGSTLKPSERELTILAVTREKDAAYEWASHVATGRQGGLREEAIDQLVAVIKRDRAWKDDGARKQLLQFFEAWGPMDEMTKLGRRKLSSVLFS